MGLISQQKNLTYNVERKFSPSSVRRPTPKRIYDECLQIQLHSTNYIYVLQYYKEPLQSMGLQTKRNKEEKQYENL